MELNLNFEGELQWGIFSTRFLLKSSESLNRVL